MHSCMIGNNERKKLKCFLEATGYQQQHSYELHYHLHFSPFSSIFNRRIFKQDVIFIETKILSIKNHAKNEYNIF